ncbi:MAG: hypothetical protein R6X02_02600 [Enhygromyxa sp.]
MSLGELVLGLGIAFVVLVGVLFYVVARQRSEIDTSKTPELPPEREAPAPAAHAIVHVHAGQPLSEQLRTHAHAAESRGLRPFFEVGAIWCPPSRLFGEALTDPRMEAALAGVYLIRADMDEFGGDPKLRELGVSAVPVFFELDAEGQATGRSMTGAAWGADTIENMSGAIAKFCG